MSIGKNELLLAMAIALCAAACERMGEKRGYEGDARTAEGGLVRPLDDDAGEEIVSWVDRQPVTDWPAEITKRETAIQQYLNDAESDRAAKYGFRSGQHPRLAWSWFRDNPVGFNGVPFVLFKTILDLDPDHQDPTLRTIARIWKHEASMPMGPA